MPTLTYSVYPRYTPGSPAQVDQATALRVARDEREAYAELLTPPILDPIATRRAKGLGLRGIVVATWEVGRKAYRRDILTGHIEFRMLRPITHPNGATFHEERKR